MRLHTLKRGASEIGDLAGVVASATFVVGAEAANVINVAIQLNDYKGEPISWVAALPWYLSSDAAGQTIPSAPSGGIAIGTDGTLIEWAANLSGLVISEADGDIDVDITDTGTPTFYLHLVLPDGRLASSGAITFA